jgi:hypothetical protein
MVFDADPNASLDGPPLPCPWLNPPPVPNPCNPDHSSANPPMGGVELRKSDDTVYKNCPSGLTFGGRPTGALLSGQPEFSSSCQIQLTFTNEPVGPAKFVDVYIKYQGEWLGAAPHTGSASPSFRIQFDESN